MTKDTLFTSHLTSWALAADNKDNKLNNKLGLTWYNFIYGKSGERNVQGRKSSYR